MRYKTIVLELLQLDPARHNQLCSTRTLLPTLERYARQLKSSHEAWQDRLRQALPGSDQRQIASEALEMALWELESYFQPGFRPDDS